MYRKVCQVFRKGKVKERSKVKVDLENAKKIKMKYRKPDDIEEDWEKDLEEELGKGEDEEIASEGTVS